MNSSSTIWLPTTQPTPKGIVMMKMNKSVLALAVALVAAVLTGGCAQLKEIGRELSRPTWDANQAAYYTRTIEYHDHVNVNVDLGGSFGGGEAYLNGYNHGRDSATYGNKYDHR